MSRDDIQKLLGGYATGTLTPEEQQALFEAALTDQELFDALAREEALREVLSDPSARAQLLAAIDDAPAAWYRQWWRPMLVMATALLIVVGVALWDRSPAPRVRETAKVELPRFRPPVEAPSAPVLPPPPDLKRSVPPMTPLSLPGAKPVAPPAPPPAQAADAKLDSSVSPGIPAPMQQSQQAPAPQQVLPAAAPPAPPVPQPSPAIANRMLAPASVPLRGVVTDSAGSAIPSATVVVSSTAPGGVVNTSTDARGEFSASAVPGSTIQIRASAQGFRSAAVSQTVPANGAPEPVNLKLEVGAVTSTVEVTAQGSVVPATRAAGGGGRGGRGGPGGIGGAATALKAAKVVPRPAIECRLLRRVSGGDPIEVPAEGTVPAGSALILRVTSIADGYLRIVPSTGSAVASPRVRRAVPFEMALPQFDQAGRVELQVFFSSQATESKDRAPTVTIVFNVQ